MEAVLRVSEARVNGHVYHRLLIPKKMSRLLKLRHKDVVTLDIMSIARDGHVVGPGSQRPLSLFLRPTNLERDIDDEKD